MKLAPCLLLGPLLGCAATPGEESEPAEPVIAFDDLPPSAFASVVRILEALDAQRFGDARVWVRAVEGDSLRDTRGGRDYARVMLDVTVLAPALDRARAVFEELERALAEEARATERVDRVERHRIARVFESMDWAAADTPAGVPFEELVSISDSIRLEVTEPRADATREAPPFDDADDADDATEAAGRYIRSMAAGAAIGPVATDAGLVRAGAGNTDLRYRIRPASPRASFSRLQIAQFLQQLEAGSPGVRVTHLAISPGTSEPVGESAAADAWRFEAAISIRLEGTRGG